MTQFTSNTLEYGKDEPMLSLKDCIECTNEFDQTNMYWTDRGYICPGCYNQENLQFNE